MQCCPLFQVTVACVQVTAFFSTLRAMLNDRLDRAELVVAAGAISIYAGAGLIFGPYIEVLVLQWLGPRSNFLVPSHHWLG